MSLPVVVIVHGNQEPQALATITWDNAFGEWGRRPFHITDKVFKCFQVQTIILILQFLFNLIFQVTWGEMGKALNTKWTGACGSPLTEENLYYLACKALRNNSLPR
jgi:signal transducer and activator of transcription 5B